MDVSASTEKPHDHMLCTFPFQRPWLRGEITYLEDIKDNNKKTNDLLDHYRGFQ